MFRTPVSNRDRLNMLKASQRKSIRLDLTEGERLRQRVVFVEGRERSSLRVVPRSIPQPVGRLRPIEGSGLEKAIRASPVRIFQVGGPSFVGADGSCSAPVEDVIVVIIGQLHRSSARVAVDGPQAPATENHGSRTALQPFAPFTPRQFINIAGLHVVSLVVLAD